MDNIAVSCVLSILSFHAIFASSIRRQYGVDPVPDPKAEHGLKLSQEQMDTLHIWQNGIIPYHLEDFSFDKVLRDKIRMYLNEINRMTALRFEEIPKPPSDNDTRWVFFINRRSLLRCADNNFNDFTNAGVQRVVLGYDCMNSDENLAAIVLSLVGVPPQHNAPDRDQFVNIVEENILPDKLILFEKIKDTAWLFHNLKYDYDSAGHYGPFKYTSNGNVTVQRKPRTYYSYNSLGPPPPKPKEKGFSTQDVLKIAMLYNYITRKQEIPVPGCSELYGKKVRLLKQVYDEKKQNKKTSNSEINESYDGDDNENGDDSEEDTDYVNDDDDVDDDENVDDSEDGDDDNGDDNGDDNVDDEDNEGNVDDEDNEGNIDNSGYYTNNNKGGKEKQNETNYIYTNNKNDAKLKDELYDGNNKSSHEHSKSDDSDSNEYNATEIMKSTTTEFPPTTTEISRFTTITEFPRFTTTTEFPPPPPYYEDDRMRLILNRQNKLLSNKKSLLGQSDYETGDEDKNKYIHEKNL